MNLPYLVAINLTRRCNLDCPHCYIDAVRRRSPDPDELTTVELVGLLRQIADWAPGTIVVLTGGEPLLHPRTDELVAAGAEYGLRMVLGTNGVLLDPERVLRLRALGLAGAGISLDGVTAQAHDAFRGVPGSFERSSSAIRACRDEGLHAQLHFTVHRGNRHELARAVELGRELGASIVNFFFLVCVGRGRNLIDLDPAQYEQALEEIAALQRSTHGLMVQARCAPHFKRVLHQHDPQSPWTRATGYDGGGCPAGTHYCRIDPTGEVTPCPYLDCSAGNVRRTPLREIWSDSLLFRQFRAPELGGRCGRCEFRTLCGGCRARGLAAGGSLWAEDPSCGYEPRGAAPVPACELRGDAAQRWTPEARERLQRVPVFLRGRIERALERQAVAEGGQVTVELMQRYRAQRERELGFRLGGKTDG